ncbi:phosphatidate phosphatase LPIN3 isoform X2 [Daktulosphaira vitifoliae]|uniref:phosphatidate phosphatase LPIN3 isoform X2 n=1 Tax=Daktulosphaira vitifoliae TaxID=58002 RepID=UPI0021AA4294|nr:phosphatidate phosphatase LPIN3 isoform X2 [Daktulosphaira vitifoliae]
MNYLGKFISNFRHVYNEINPATLTGAIDIIVVEQPDGTFTCSPFHVRFGKIGVLRSREKIVEVEINGEPSYLHMKLGESGEAFFVEEISEEDNREIIPPHLACSPIPDDESRKTVEYAVISQSDLAVPKTFCAETIDNRAIESSSLKFRPIEDSPPKPQMRKRRRKKSMIKRKDKDETKVLSNIFGSCDLSANSHLADSDDRSQYNIDNDLHFFSDTDASPSSNTGEIRHNCTTVQSDTEYEFQQRARNSAIEIFLANSNTKSADLQSGVVDHQSWRWGELPTPPARRCSLDSNDSKLNLEEVSKKQEAANQRSMLANMLGFMKKTKHIRHNSSENAGIYLADLCAEQLDPKVLDMYLYNQSPPRQDDEVKVIDLVEDDDVESGKGPSLSHSPTSMDREGPKSIDSDFDEKLYSNVGCEVTVSLCGGLNNLDSIEFTEKQFLAHQISYAEFTSDFSNLVKNPNLVVCINKKYYSCQDALPQLISIAAYQKLLPQNEVFDSKVQVDNTKVLNKGYTSWFNWSRARKDTKPKDSTNNTEDILKNSSQNLPNQILQNPVINEIIKSEIEGKIESEISNDNYIRQRCYSSTDSELDMETSKLTLKSKDKNEKYRKTLRLTSEQIGKLNLREGSNELVFSVTTAYQGTSHCKCFLYKWRYDDKIVISDIDGTITKSDVLGHILPIVGKDWAQSGVAKLFTKIKDNGYKLLYLSARAIGQSRVTREYLKSIKQEDLSLPEGPVLLNPTSLLNAFHREVIEKKPEEFKISCLKDIQALFPSDNKPFYAGYGNKINDVWSYQAIGIPISRIFTINHRGELKHELTQTFQSSYIGQSCIVNDLFPVLSNNSDVTNCNDGVCNVISGGETISTTSLECETFDIHI